jgi:hypothetical protein
MSDYIDEHLKRHFREPETVSVQSNFSWLVMQKVFVERVEQARRKAWVEILVVWLIILVAGGLLGAGLWFYTDLPVWQFEIPRLGIACAAIFALFLLVDLVLRSRLARWR